MRRGIAEVLLLFASAAFAYEHPVLTPSIVTMRPGETRTLALSTWWSGLTPMPQHNVFVSDAPGVAEANGSLTSAGTVGVAPVLEPVKVVAHTPGVAHVIDLAQNQALATIVVTCDSPGSAVAFPVREVVSATPLQTVTLEVGTAGFENPSYAWYNGSTGDFTVPFAGNMASSEVTVRVPGVFHFWAEVWDTCNHATVDFTIEVAIPPNRRRAARH